VSNETRFDKFLKGEQEETRFDEFVEPEGIPLPVLAGEAFVDSGLAVPSGSGDALAFLAGGAEGLAAGPFTERGFDFSNRIQEQQEQFPASLLRDIPRPTSAGIVSGLRSIPEGITPGGETFSEAFGGEMADFDAARMTTEREHPFASNLFTLGGQGLALATGRLPLLNRISKGENAITTIRKSPEIASSTAQLQKAPVTIHGAVWDGVKQSKTLRNLMRGTGRSVEAGLEATVLDIINNGTPGETFGYAAGLQLANSGVLQGAKTLAGGSKLTKLNKMTVALVLGATAVSQFQNITPLEDDFGHALTESSRHITVGLAIGALSGLVGGGRFRGSTKDMSKQAQSALDMITSVPRTTVTGMVRQWNESSPEGQEAMQALMNGVAMNPTALNDRELARISSSIEKGTFEDTATVMMRDNRLTERLFSEPDPVHEFDPSAFSGMTFEKPTR